MIMSEIDNGLNSCFAEFNLKGGSDTILISVTLIGIFSGLKSCTFT